ncbi:MAG TPA: thiamine pyrophosphate-binding protein [Bryobacteraceae bacterium]|nr:thiamine pyrophosphate-binding protein [Bryobacteraceae bacterium]
MQHLIHRYLNHSLSRRGLLRGLSALGFTSAAAQAILQPLEASETATTRAGAPGSTLAEGTGGELVVAQAKAAGAQYLFTNPGSFEVGLFDAVIDNPGIQLIMGLHEGIVISMADGYHRASGKPAFVNVHVVAGTAQMAGQLYNASRDGSALVITAGLNDNERWSDESILAARPGYDQKEIARQFTKISWEARTAESLPLMLRRAFKTAATEPGGPVYLAMAHYALEARGVKARILPENRFMLRTSARPSASAVQDAARMLVEAARPLLVVGDEVWKSGAQAELLALSEKLGLPVADTTTIGYRNFPVRHPHYVGPFSMTSAWVRKGVDLILCVGSRDFGGRVVPASPEAPEQARIVRLGMDTASMSRNYATDLALVGDVKEGLADLRAAVESLLSKSRLENAARTRSEEVRAITSAARASAASARARVTGRSPMHPEEVGAILSRSLDKNAIVVSENITGSYGSFPFGFRDDEQMWLGNSGLGLGWGIGAATGAKLAAPARQVVCSIGDGSVMYSASGFWTQVRYGIPVLTVVWNNLNYQTVRHAYHNYNGRMAKSGHYAGMYLGDPDIDFVKLAESQGVQGEKAAAAADLESALKRGIAATRNGKPYLIEVATARVGGGAESTWHDKFKLAGRA